jgi:protein-S-isoprenylcysteine O-methyltransferase Ste14
MFFRDIQQRSTWPKCLVSAALVLAVLVSADILFGNRLGLALWNNPYRGNGDLVRDSMVMACLVIYLVRVMVSLFMFFRRILYWREALFIANVMPWCLVYFAFYGAEQTEPVGLTEGIGAVLFVLGSYLSSAGEYARHRWKQEPSNAGRLYTGGLFSSVRHINYSGDVVLFSGIALVAHQFGLLLIPAAMAFIFLLVLAPLKERYLSAKYGQEFDDYAARTKMLIPLVV